MRLTPVLIAVLPLTVTAEQQKPLGGSLQTWFEWFDKAKSYIPNAASAPLSTAAKAASSNVVSLTKDNWKSVLKPSTSDQFEGPESWMIFISGGNKTCYGKCGGVEQAWNKASALLAVDPSSPRLAYINCDKQPVLCSIWATGPPKIWHVQLPVAQADQSTPATTVRIIGLNTTTTTAVDITQIHTKRTYENKPVYEGALHPFNGWVAQYGLLTPLGYTLYLFAIVPSWAFMIGISMFSRYFM
ncbi:MAG: hypothetical protein Q9196_002445 [Gyalolechia fulgens]